MKHKYSVGATVYFTASNVSRPAASGTYEVIRQLPTEGDDCQYRIKSSTEAFERVAKESQLARLLTDDRASSQLKRRFRVDLSAVKRPVRRTILRKSNATDRHSLC